MAVASNTIEVDVPTQTLTLKDSQGRILMQTKVSTARNGVGEEAGSEKTPRGAHYIRAKIGAGLPPNSVLISRRPTNEIYSPQLRSAFPNRDWILTRILWLCGLERGKNRLGKVDTMQRYIYISTAARTKIPWASRAHVAASKCATANSSNSSTASLRVHA